MGILIVIDGLDGSGKATQTQLLYKALCEDGRKVMTVAFPDYDSLSSGPVRMYLSGELADNAEDVNAYASSSFFSVDRYCRYMTELKAFYESGGIIIADRYTTANAIHQCSKLPKEEWQNFIDWLFDFEYNKLGLPKPNEVIFLSVDPKVSSSLMDKRYSEGGERDIHEADENHQNAAAEAAQFLANKLGWRVVHCQNNSEMRSREDIAKEVYNFVTKTC